MESKQNKKYINKETGKKIIGEDRGRSQSGNASAEQNSSAGKVWLSREARVLILLLTKRNAHSSPLKSTQSQILKNFTAKNLQGKLNFLTMKMPAYMVRSKYQIFTRYFIIFFINYVLFLFLRSWIKRRTMSIIWCLWIKKQDSKQYREFILFYYYLIYTFSLSNTQILDNHALYFIKVILNLIFRLLKSRNC